MQGACESGENFILGVKLLAEACDFGVFRDSAIRDQLVFGVYDKEVQHRLLQEDDLTLRMAEKIIKNREIATTRVQVLNQDSAINSVKFRLGNRDNRSDFRNMDERGRRRSRSRSRDRQANRYVNHRERSRTNQRSTSRGRYSNFVCHFCNKKGHIQKNCYKFKNTRRHSVNSVAETNKNVNVHDYFKRLRVDYDTSDNESGDYPCAMIKSVNKVSEPCLLDVNIAGKLCKMEVDSGSAVTVMSKADFYKRLGHITLNQCKKRLVVINGSSLNVLGKILVIVSLNGKSVQLELIILDCSHRFVPLLGRDWLDVLCEDWRKQISSVFSIKFDNCFSNTEQIISDMKSKFCKIFDNDFSLPISGFEAELVINDNQPIFRKAYEVPYRLRDKINEHLNELERVGIITPIKTSLWASPVIAVIKKDGSIRLVIDCKVSINKVMIPNTYPLPTAQDLFASLAGCKIFCSLDLTAAYTQMNLSEKSRKYCVINTIKGLYIYNRLPQGAASSAAIFQQFMDGLLKGLDFVFGYLDDVLIAGKNFKDCKQKLQLVLERLENANVKVNADKCKFFVTTLPYLGHIISEKGLQPDPQKVETIRMAKVPENVTELKSFLGLINYYGKFLPNLSIMLNPLYNLLKKDTKFLWTPICDKTFQECKERLLETKFLTFFDPDKPLVVCADASSYGLGGLIAHETNGTELPICFTSFSLNTAQKKYPILHLEALAIVSTVKKFHKYLFGKKFTIYTDHKPLLGILGKSGRNAIFVTRLQRYIMELSIYDYDIVYRPSAKMANADFCSRFPLKDEVPTNIENTVIKSINFDSAFPLNSKDLAKETKNDKILQQVLFFLKRGWPERMEKCFKDIYSQHHDLEEVDGCLLFQDRVIIPESLKSLMLKLLHTNHIGIVKMKQQARRCVYWFGINRDIENFVGNCDICAKMEVVKDKNKTYEWTPTNRPFSRIHADFFYFERQIFLLIVDSYSKWLELDWMKNGTDAEKVIKKFVNLFSRFGLPDVIVTDNGPPFNSQQFINFFERQGIHVMKSPPYHPQSNGQAERLVRVVKEVMKKILIDPAFKNVDLQDKLNYFLFNYRNTVLSPDMVPPSEKILNYRPKTLLDLVNPTKRYKNMLSETSAERVAEMQNSDKEHGDPFSNLTTGDKVHYKNPNKNDILKWLDGADKIEKAGSKGSQINDAVACTDSLGGRPKIKTSTE
ncbi:uncharacterized protein K02A2.6-like [Malaya genurostris]|uniref:uncharacterized protein K02A2.6-like n=1 Tax=Malaya genurostris TaxID=325434 RepID=UPI0026F3B358|nr:uncharacterized protein K02A2.6-like [Malaya genurostris]